MSLVNTVVFANFDFKLYVCGSGVPNEGCNRQIVVSDMVVEETLMCKYSLFYWSEN